MHPTAFDMMLRVAAGAWPLVLAIGLGIISLAGVCSLLFADEPRRSDALKRRR